MHALVYVEIMTAESASQPITIRHFTGSGACHIITLKPCPFFDLNILSLTSYIKLKITLLPVLCVVDADIYIPI
jgi:hypothetical protein